jgi:hypothetical protein
MAWACARLCKLQKRCTRLAAATDKAYQLLAHGRWFSPGTPASSTTKAGRHDIVEILLKVALNTINKSINQLYNACKAEYDIKGFLIGFLENHLNEVCFIRMIEQVS